MKCPKCGQEATEMDEVVFVLESFEDPIRHWIDNPIFIRYIHFKCPEAKTPNFVFYIEKE